MIENTQAESKGGFWTRLADNAHLGELVTALRKKSVPIHRNSFWYYAGGLTLVFFTIQIITGLLLLIFYTPTAEGAHKSVEMIVTQVPYGWLIRSVHSWSANALMLAMLVHMFSVFLMKSYRTPREIMWLTGMLLLFLMAGFGFTGYLLPWDQTAYFATKIGTEVPKSIPLIGGMISSLIRGSNEVSGATLTRLYALHVGVLPLIAIGIVFAHTTLTALLGTSTPIGATVKKRIYFIPDYMLGEGVVWLVGFALLLAVAFLYPWQLGPAYDLMNPTEPPAGVHPEWYFMFLFQTLRYIPEWAVVIGFGIVMLFWTLVPWLDRKSRQNKKSPIFTIVGIIAILYFVVLTTIAYLAVTTEQQEAKTPPGKATSAVIRPPIIECWKHEVPIAQSIA